MRTARRFWLSGGISVAAALVLLLSGGRSAPLPRFGCDHVTPSVVRTALAAAAVMAAPLRQNGGKQRQRCAATSCPDTAHGIAASARSGVVPAPLKVCALAPTGAARLPHACDIRGMLPLAQAPPLLHLF